MQNKPSIFLIRGCSQTGWEGVRCLRIFSESVPNWHHHHQQYQHSASTSTPASSPHSCNQIPGTLIAPIHMIVIDIIIVTHFIHIVINNSIIIIFMNPLFVLHAEEQTEHTRCDNGFINSLKSRCTAI